MQLEREPEVVTGLFVVTEALIVDREKCPVVVRRNTVRLEAQRNNELDRLVDALGVAVPLVEAVLTGRLRAVHRHHRASRFVDRLVVAIEQVLHDANRSVIASERLEVRVAAGFFGGLEVAHQTGEVGAALAVASDAAANAAAAAAAVRAAEIEGRLTLGRLPGAGASAAVDGAVTR